jgi:hypothetical protein
VKQDMTDELNKLNAAMDARAAANGEAFSALQAGLNALKKEVVALAAATHTEHENIRRDMLARLDALIKLTSPAASGAPAPQGQAKTEGKE